MLSIPARIIRLGVAASENDASLDSTPGCAWTVSVTKTAAKADSHQAHK